MSWYCTSCGGAEATISTAPYKYNECGLDNVTLAGVEERTCKTCGEREVAIPGVPKLHRLLAEMVASKPGLLTPREFRFLRKYLGFSQADFAKKLDMASETLSRWETGAQPIGRAQELLLRVLARRHERVDCYPEIPEPEATREPIARHIELVKGGWMQAAG